MGYPLHAITFSATMAVSLALSMWDNSLKVITSSSAWTL